MEEQVLWIARDKDNSLFIYSKKPIKDYNCYVYDTYDDLDSTIIPEELYPELNFENSPKQLIIKED